MVVYLVGWIGRISMIGRILGVGQGGLFLFDRHGAFAIGVGGAAPELAAVVFALASGAECHEFAALGALGDLALIGLIGRIGLIVFATLLDSGSSKLLGEAAAFDESLL